MQLLCARNKKMWLGLANSKGISSPKLSLALHRDRCQVWEWRWLLLLATNMQLILDILTEGVVWLSGFSGYWKASVKKSLKKLEASKLEYSIFPLLGIIFRCSKERRISRKRTIRDGVDSICQYLKTRWMIPGWEPRKTCNLSQLRRNPVTFKVAT